jgi:hypothetical protein
MLGDGGGRDIVRGIVLLAGLGEVAGPDPVGAHLVGAHVDQRHELRVGDVAVVALQEVVDDVLPVGPDVIGQPLRERQVRDIRRPERDVLRQIRRLHGQRGGGRVEIDVHKPPNSSTRT